MNSRRKRTLRTLDQNGGMSPIGMLRLDRITPGYRKALWIVIAMTGAMFALETAAGHLFHSQVLKADALDFLDDTLAYVLSLAVVGASIRRRAAAAILKAAVLCLMSIEILGSAIYHLFFLPFPHPELMGAVGLLGLLVNTACLAILAPYENGNMDVQALHIDSRHDLLGNTAVIVAAAGVWAMQSPWPDLLIAIMAAAHCLFFAFRMLLRAVRLHRTSGNVARH